MYGQEMKIEKYQSQEIPEYFEFSAGGREF